MLLRLVYPTSLVLLSCWQMRRGLWTPDFLNMSSAAKREMVFHERVKCLNICYVFCVLLWKEYWFTQHSSMFYVSVVNLFPGSSFQTSGGSFVGFQLLSSEKSHNRSHFGHFQYRNMLYVWSTLWSTGFRQILGCGSVCDVYFHMWAPVLLLPVRADSSPLSFCLCALTLHMSLFSS